MKPGRARVEAQRCEPHLPIQSRLVRRDEARPAVHITRFPFEFVGVPGDAIVASFDDDFETLGRHHCEETVAVDQAEWFEPFRKFFERRRPADPETQEPADHFGGQECEEEGHGNGCPNWPAR